MAKRLTLVLAVAMLVVLAAGTVWGAKQDPQKYVSKNILGNEYPDYLVGGAAGVLNAAPLSPYDEILGLTYYDYQHNSRIPHMIANDYQVNRGLHFTFMEMEEPPGNRYVNYNYWDVDGWTSVPPPSKRISVTTGRGGYTGVDLIRPLDGYFKAHSRAVICHHYTEVVYPNAEEMNAVIVIEPSIPGAAGMDGGQYWYDIPEWVPPSNFGGMWPSCGVDSLNRIHIVMDEGNTAAGLGWLGYVRCYEIVGDSIVCESPGKTTHRLAKEKYYSELDWGIASFGTTGAISNLVVTSKVSNKVALAWVSVAETMTDSGQYQNCNDVFYIESSTGGNDWIAGGSFPARINVSQFQPADPYRSYGEISGLYDFNDSLHLFFVGQGYEQATNTVNPDDVVLFHWSKATERTCGTDFYPVNKVTQTNWDSSPYTGAWNRAIAKVTSGIGIIDSTIDAAHYNKNYIYVQFTRFDDQSDTSAVGNPALWNEAENEVQGEIYATLSTDLGFTWMSPVNLTQSWVDHCASGNCASDHWSSIAERVDTSFYSQWIYDRDAGGAVQDEGLYTNNEVLYKAFPTSTIPIVEEARLAWSPGGWVQAPVNIPVSGTKTVYLTLENIGTEVLNITSVTTDDPWLTITNVPTSLAAGGCPGKVSLKVTGEGSCSFKVGSVNVVSDDQGGNDDINIPIHVVEDNDFAPSDFATLSNPIYYLSVSNTGNLGHQVDTAGMNLYTLTEPLNFIFDASPAVGYVVPGNAVPASAQNDTLVGRYIFEERYLQSAKPLDIDTVPGLKTKKALGEFWPIRIQVPPEDQYWPWWKGQIQEHVMYSADTGSTPNKNEQYMALVVLKLFHSTPPCWWVSLSPPATYPMTLLGMALDIDAPADSDSWNYPGYDEALRMGSLAGYGPANGAYSFAIAQRDTCYTSPYLKCWPNPGTLAQKDEPYAMNILRNDVFVYPQNGYRDDSLYKYMNTPGYSIYETDDPVEADYNIVTTGAVISNHSLTDTFEVRYALLISDKFGPDKMDTLITSIQCGNTDRDKVVGLADVVFLINYVLKGGDETWLYMSDLDGNCGVGLADIVWLINYLFRSGPDPKCSCLR
jgi:hypothetical protein